MSIKNDEQWLSNGNCEECHKQNYCSKPCTIRKQKENYMLKNAVLKTSKLDKAFEMLSGVNNLRNKGRK